jgi:hypothetical protein
MKKMGVLLAVHRTLQNDKQDQQGKAASNERSPHPSQ